MKDSLKIREWNWFLKQLKVWYSPDKRKLPWKDLDDAYLVWVSEVFLQQTQADRVIEFWLRFTAKFPRVEDLAAASFEEALPYFRGLGFYGRLRRMLLTAEAVVERSRVEGRESRALFPRELEELKKLPGIGPYTARAVASFAYGERVLAPDTNVVRIIGRFFGVEKDLKEPKDLKDLKGKMNKWVMKNLEFFDAHYPEDFSLNQVLMDFGSSVCMARKPKCESCPLVKKCEFGRDPGQFEKMKVEGREARVESREGKQRSLRSYQKIVVGVLIQDKHVLVSRRKEDQTFAGLLEFPGGKVEEGEDLRAAMQREFREEVGVEVSVRPAFEKMAVHRQKLLLHFHRCRVLTKQNDQIPNPNDQGKRANSQGPRAKGNNVSNNQQARIFAGCEGQELMWIRQEDLDAKQFLPANKGVIEVLKKSRL